MTKVADRYILESGRRPDYGLKEMRDDLHDAAMFLAWAEDAGAVFGGVEAKDAMRAMCRTLNLNPRALRKAIMGPTR